MEIDPPVLGLAQPVTRGRDALVLQISSADRPVAFSTSTHGGGRVVPSIDSCMGRTGKYHREQSLNCSSRISEGAFISERSSGLDAWHSGLLSCYDWQAGDFFV